MRAIFVLTVFLGASLLFVVQPMAARGVLPVLGGGAAVWTTAMLFFQAVLLLGYVYAHALARLARPATQALVHAGVLALAVAASALLERAPRPPAPGAWPVGWVLATLGATVGPGFFALASAGPLLQRWFAGVGDERSARPYFLYAASNAGSFVGLLAYPFVLERALALGEQRALWVWGLLVFACLMVACGAARARSRAPDAGAPGTGGPVRARDRARWTLLAFIPSSLMIGVTAYLSSDIAAFPLLWVVPLAVYLASFTLAFGRAGPALAHGLARAGPIALIALVLAFMGGRLGLELPTLALLAMHLAGFAVVATWVHARLAASAPAPDRLTEFYLFVAIGGVLGGVFNAVVAPLVFVVPVEYPLVLALAGFTLPVRPWGGRVWRAARLVIPVALLAAQAWVIHAVSALEGWPAPARAAAVLTLPAAAALVTLRDRLAFALTLGAGVGAGALSVVTNPGLLEIDRSFYGVMRVTATPFEHHAMHELTHGTTTHGMQVLSPDDRLRRVPLAYYHPAGPAGEAFRALRDRGAGPLRVGVVGLGTGALAAYARPGDAMTFYELDPEVAEIARDPDLFTYLADAEGEVEVAIGDGRRLLAGLGPATRYDLLVLDAFSSDAVPVHLLTREAFELYTGLLAPGGLVLAHVSNRYLDLPPVIGAAAESIGARARVRVYEPLEEDAALGAVASTWVVVTEPGAPAPTLPGPWQTLRAEPGRPAWTDARSDVVSVISWWR